MTFLLLFNFVTFSILTSNMLLKESKFVLNFSSPTPLSAQRSIILDGWETTALLTKTLKLYSPVLTSQEESFFLAF